MVKLTFAEFKNPLFDRALSKVMHHGGYKSTKISTDIAKLGKKFREETALVQELYLKLVKKHAKLDEKGEIEPRKENGKTIPGTFWIEDSRIEEWKAACIEFDSTEVELPCHNIHMEDLEGVGLSPADLIELAPLITESPKAPVSPIKPKLIDPNTGAPALQ